MLLRPRRLRGRLRLYPGHATTGLLRARTCAAAGRGVPPRPASAAAPGEPGRHPTPAEHEPALTHPDPAESRRPRPATSPRPGRVRSGQKTLLPNVVRKKVWYPVGIVPRSTVPRWSAARCDLRKHPVCPGQTVRHLLPHGDHYQTSYPQALQKGCVCPGQTVRHHLPHGATCEYATHTTASAPQDQPHPPAAPPAAPTAPQRAPSTHPRTPSPSGSDHPHDAP